MAIELRKYDDYTDCRITARWVVLTPNVPGHFCDAIRCSWTYRQIFLGIMDLYTRIAGAICRRRRNRGVVLPTRLFSKISHYIFVFRMGSRNTVISSARVRFVIFD